MQEHDKPAGGSKDGSFSRNGLARYARPIFVVALAVVLYFAWMPAPPTVLDNDKSQHMLAFAVLTVLFRAAFPAQGWRGALLWLAGLGALIEIVQAIPALHRDCDINDWLADMAAVLVALVGVALVTRLFARA